MVRKRRHHYVWQHYLRAWSVDGVVTCLRDGRVFRSSTENLAVKTDFYRLNKLSANEIGFIRKICLEPAEPFLREINRRWLPLFLAPYALKELAQAVGGESPALKQEIDEYISNAEEDLQGHIEAQALDYLAKLREGILDFLATADERASFTHFLAVQYFRTVNIRDAVSTSLEGLQEVEVERMWGVMSHIFSTNVSYALFQRFDQSRVTLITAPSGSEFITADQPVINLEAVGTQVREPVDDLTLYYPISPTAALLWSVDVTPPGMETKMVPPAEVRAYNEDMFSMARSQVYGTSPDILSSLVG